MSATSGDISQKDLSELLEHFERKSFEAVACDEGTVEYHILQKCELLMRQDYSLLELDNTNGTLSPRYPGRIFIPEYEHNHACNSAHQSMTTMTASHPVAHIHQFHTNSHYTHHNHHANPQTNNYANAKSSNATNSAKSNPNPSTAANVSDGIQNYLTFANLINQQQQGQQQQSISNSFVVDSANSFPESVPAPRMIELPPSSDQLDNKLDFEMAENISNQQQHRYPHHTAHIHETTARNSSTSATIYEDPYDANRIRELITMAKYARCWQRFVVPVLMYRGKYICRSSTISVMPETFGRKVVDFAYDCINGTNYYNNSGGNNNSNERDNANNMNTFEDNNENSIGDIGEDSLMNQDQTSHFSYEEAIKSDVQLLDTLNVSSIVDLMVEKRKIKYFMAVSSSEKADPENHYENFNLISLPYPGCEFFSKFRDNNYMARDLHYNWKQSFNDAMITVPKLGPAADLDINWFDYRQWDLLQITQNYLKVCLKYIQEESSGLLVHCISGWDRTPLFISLIRLSLWADNLVHQSLNAIQMAYLTLAYDWYLFGHQLSDRLKRGEDIMFFCFHVLKYIVDEEFSIIEYRKRTKTTSSSGSSSVIVIRSDSCEEEVPKNEKDVLLGFDGQDSNDSFSNGSICDILITENFYANNNSTINSSAANTTSVMNGTQGNVFPMVSNRSPNPKRSRTSPISVPGCSSNGSSGSSSRQRQESTSSNGSWQVVTDTGSIDSMLNGSYMMRFINQHHQQQQQQLTTAAANTDALPFNTSNCSTSGTGVIIGNGICDSGGGGGEGVGASSSTIPPTTACSNTNSNNNSVSGGSVSSIGSSAGSNSLGATNYPGNFPITAHSTCHPGGQPTNKISAISLRKQRLNAVRAIFIQTYGKTVGLKFKEGSAMNLTTFIGNLADQLF